MNSFKNNLLVALIGSVFLGGCFGGDPDMTPSWRAPYAGDVANSAMQLPIDKDSSIAFQPPIFDNPGDFGTLTRDNGGADDTIWDGVDRGLADTLPIAPPVKAGAANFKKMLLSQARTPADLGGAWLNRRIETLAVIGHKNETADLALQSLRGRDMNDQERADMIQLLLWANQKDAACLEALGNNSGDPALSLAQSFCLASMGQKQAGRTKWDSIRTGFAQPDENGDSLANYIDQMWDGVMTNAPEGQWNTLLAFGRNQLAGQNSALPEPFFLQQIRATEQARYAEAPARATPEEFMQAGVARQPGHVVLLTYDMVATARAQDSGIAPAIADAAIDAWRALGWDKEAGILQSELARLKDESASIPDSD